jgi:hypothetical protein
MPRARTPGVAALVTIGGAIALAHAVHGQLATGRRSLLVQNLSGPGRLGAASAVGDFDGDGFDDLAIGRPDATGEDGESHAGAVIVYYGSPDGLHHVSSEQWSQDTPGVPGEAEADERFGSALAAGDFDGDGFDELAIGVPSDLDAEGDAVGAAIVLLGSATGLTAAGAQRWTQDTAGISGVAEAGDLFGQALAGADFDGDGFDDLGIGAPGENRSEVPPWPAEGAVHALYGTASGLGTGDDGLWVGSDLGVGITSFFGSTLAAGPLLDGDATAELVVGIPGAGGVHHGAIRVFRGGAGGLSSSDVESESGDQAGEFLGGSVAIGDLDGDGFADLAVGAPGFDLGQRLDVGRVKIFFGGFAALIPWLSLDQESAEVPGLAEEDDRFGGALAIGDFDHNGYGDLAVGAPFEDWAEVADAGALVVVHFEAAGPMSVARNQQFSRGDLHPDGSGLGDHFASALAAVDFDATSHADLAIGVPDRGGPLDDDAGEIWVLSGALFADDFESGDTSAWSSVAP